jgi:hypothetical protein
MTAPQPISHIRIAEHAESATRNVALASIFIIASPAFLTFTCYLFTTKTKHIVLPNAL